LVSAFPPANAAGESAETSVIKSAANRICMGGLKQKIRIPKGKTGGGHIPGRAIGGLSASPPATAGRCSQVTDQQLAGLLGCSQHVVQPLDV
jgi:hypothetical protein